MIKGIDVSAFQSTTFDLTGLDFVFTKITEGLSYVNPKWVQQRDHAKSKGLVWGAYHYPHMANDPIKEADYFLKQVKWAPGDLIALDWEGYDKANEGVSDARKVAYRDAWLKYVKGKMPGHRVGMYCNTDYWTRVDTTSNCGDFLWIATGGKPAGQPGIKAAWVFHQYSDANDLDHDVANFPSRAALAAWAAGTPTTSTKETDMALADADLAKIALAVQSYKGKGETHDAYWYTRDTHAGVVALTAQVGALTAAIGKLAQGGGLDAAEIKAAAEAGAQAALDRLGDALKED